MTTTTTTIPHVINASAGTGKTTLLLQDVLLDLLRRSDGDAEATIRNSLLITFTVAATAEMRQRLEDDIRFCIDYAHDATLHDDRFRIGGDGSDLAKAIRANANAESVFRKALDELPTMQISTIDSLNKLIVDRNADVLDDVHPGYELVADDAMRHTMQHSVLDELFEQWYATDDPHHREFIDLLDNYGGPQRDGDLQNVMLSLYETALTKPNKLAWLEGMEEPYNTVFDDATVIYDANPFYRKLIDDDYEQARHAVDAAHACAEQLREAYSPATSTADFSNGSVFFSTVERLRDSLDVMYTGTWRQIHDLFGEIQPMLSRRCEKRTIFTGLVFTKSKPNEEETGNAIKAIQDLKSILKGDSDRRSALPRKWNTVFSKDQETTNTLNAVATRRLAALREFITLFDERYRAMKRERSVAEFSDVAFWALDALDHDGVLDRLSKQWQYVYVDECQDDNALQNRFIETISRNACKLTMVGDVKQSIYGFRDAAPEDFKAITETVRGERTDHIRALRHNYRSEPEIITFVNTVFNHILSEATGSVDYLQEQLAIKPTADLDRDFDPGAVELLLRKVPEKGTDVDTTDSAEAGELFDEANPFESPSPAEAPERLRASAAKQEVDMIVRRIRQLCEGANAEYSYGDIAVLSRGSTNFSDLYERLLQAGIPADVQGVGDYYKRAEVLLALDWLKIVANVHQDIPLVAVLESFGFSDEDLAAMRLLDPRGSYYGIMYRMANPSPEYPLDPAPEDLTHRVGAFLGVFDGIRTFAANHPVDETLWHIYMVTGLYDYVGKLPDGNQRKANLAELAAKARTFINTEERGIRAFLDAAAVWSTDDKANEEASTVPTKNAVHITTIHKAKGLQWPVVIVMNATSERFKNMGNSTVMVIPSASRADNHAIAGIKLKDTRHTSYMETFQRMQVTDMDKRRELADELRLLYVALTRAERKLIISGTLKPKGGEYALAPISKIDGPFDAKAVVNEDDCPDGCSYSADFLIANPNYLDWIMYALFASAGFTVPDSWHIVPVAESETQPMALPKDGRTEESPCPLLSGNRAITLHLDGEDCEPIAHMTEDTPGFDALSKRLDVTGTVGVDDLALPRIPVSVSASGARGWLATDADAPDEDGTVADLSATDDALIADDADERDWRFGAYPLPDFMSEGRKSAKPSPAEIGTAVHAVLELFDWSHGVRSDAREELLDVIDALERNGQATPAVADTIRGEGFLDGMEWFVSGRAEGGCDHLVNAIVADGPENLHREEPFTMLIDPRRLQVVSNAGADLDIAEYSDQRIVVRGIIDGYCVDPANRNIVLFDYKTDMVRSNERDDLGKWEKRLHDDYFQQQALYAEALEQRYPGYHVTERWLVGLDGRRLIDVSS